MHRLWSPAYLNVSVSPHFRDSQFPKGGSPYLSYTLLVRLHELLLTKCLVASLARGKYSVKDAFFLGSPQCLPMQPGLAYTCFLIWPCCCKSLETFAQKKLFFFPWKMRSVRTHHKLQSSVRFLGPSTVPNTRCVEYVCWTEWTRIRLRHWVTAYMLPSPCGCKSFWTPPDIVWHLVGKRGRELPWRVKGFLFLLSKTHCSFRHCWTSPVMYSGLELCGC